MRLRVALALALLAALVVTAAAVGSPKRVMSVRVPNVVGMRMDRATTLLHARKLRVNEECRGLFGCIIKANWWICAQSPHAGARVRAYSVVMIYGRRSLSEC